MMEQFDNANTYLLDRAALDPATYSKQGDIGYSLYGLLFYFLSFVKKFGDFSANAALFSSQATYLQCVSFHFIHLYRYQPETPS